MINRLVFTLATALMLTAPASAQSAEELIQRVKARLDKVNDYVAKGKMKTNVVFIKAPVASVKIYYKRPDKLRILNESGISFIPKGSVNVNLNNLIASNEGYDIVDAGREAGSNLRIVKLLPKNESSDIVLSTLFIEESNALVKKAKTTTREQGTYELEMTYGKYADYGLADKLVFTFNTKDYKLPKGVTFDYDDGSKKKGEDVKQKNMKGKVEISYQSYIVNKGVSDEVFENRR
jgi:outer membrane lipoprotein-sorting protein